MRKPIDDNKIVLLLGGLHMQGTLAATKVALSLKFQEAVKKSKNKFFVQLVKTSVLKDGFTLAPKKTIWEKYPIIGL